MTRTTVAEAVFCMGRNGCCSEGPQAISYGLLLILSLLLKSLLSY